MTGNENMNTGPDSHNVQKKIAVINDLTGFGRCSLTVSIPIISAMKVQCCPVPTSVFSNHTAYESYFFDDYTEKMPAYIAEWRRLGLRFNGIATGFLGSSRQIDIVISFIEEFKSCGTVVIVDPVMGDDGKPYATYTEELCRQMKRLAEYADILTPNLTEACILTDTPYTDGRYTIKSIDSMAKKLHEMGPERVVITGISQGSFIANYVSQAGEEPHMLRTHRVGTQRPGTGDVFSAVIAADAVNGVPFGTSVKKASNFVKKCILLSEDYGIAKEDGVCFEEALGDLAD